MPEWPCFMGNRSSTCISSKKQGLMKWHFGEKRMVYSRNNISLHKWPNLHKSLERLFHPPRTFFTLLFASFNNKHHFDKLWILSLDFANFASRTPLKTLHSRWRCLPLSSFSGTFSMVRDDCLKKTYWQVKFTTLDDLKLNLYNV